jgi:hypothetical protein
MYPYPHGSRSVPLNPTKTVESGPLGIRHAPLVGPVTKDGVYQIPFSKGHEYAVIRGKGYFVYNAKGDGNCLFNAICMAMAMASQGSKGSTSRKNTSITNCANDYRQRAVQYVKDLYSNSIQNSDVKKEQRRRLDTLFAPASDYGKYLEGSTVNIVFYTEDMGQSAVYGGPVEIEALANILQRRICLHTQNKISNSKTRPFQEPHSFTPVGGLSQGTIRLRLRDPNEKNAHYDLLVPGQISPPVQARR